ncbi:TY-Chap domain-containing protein [Williamsia sp. MIQD14]|uniref:TY-Chap domain-containing protein n=1 Tax=Williamsia sp. MIQD14 TaxID=3425703 RepID=UPI003DA09C1E
MDDTDFDSAVESAWRTFRIDLADRLARLQRGDDLEIVQSTRDLPDGPRGRLTFTVTSRHRLQCTIDAADLHTTPDCHLDQVQRLDAAGWQWLRGAQGRHVFECGRREVDALALQAQTALREIWDVLHPGFLVGDPTPVPAESELAIGVVVRTVDQLRALAVEALTEATDHAVVVDSDGDIQVPVGTLGSWLRVCDDEPHLEFFACIVDEVPDVAGAALYLATHAARWPSVGLRLIDTHMYATLRLGCATFHRANLIAALRTWTEFLIDDVPTIDAALATPPPAVDDGAVPAALMRVHHLSRYGPKPGPLTVMGLCGDNRRTAMDYIRAALGQVKSLNAAAEWATDEGDIDEARACRDEATEWRATMLLITQSLRVALRRERLRRDTPPDQRRPPTG